MNTAGRAVLFAGATVVIALMGLLALGIELLYGMALAAVLAVVFVLGASMTLLPALMTSFGDRIARPGRRARRQGTRAADLSPFWTRWADGIQRHPWTVVVASVLMMVTLTVPVLKLHLGNADAGGADEPNDAPGVRPAHEGVRQGLQRPAPRRGQAAARRGYGRAAASRVDASAHAGHGDCRAGQGQPEQRRRDDLRLPDDVAAEQTDRASREAPARRPWGLQRGSTGRCRAVRLEVAPGRSPRYPFLPRGGS